MTYEGRTVADVLAMTVDDAASRSLETLREVALGYLRLGRFATELSGDEAQRIKLATELQRARRGYTLYGVHPPAAWAEAGATWLVHSVLPVEDGWVEELQQLARQGPPR